jgi:hypothetical protein
VPRSSPERECCRAASSSGCKPRRPPSLAHLGRRPQCRCGETATTLPLRRPRGRTARLLLQEFVDPGAEASPRLLAIGYVWWCALTGRRNRGFRIAIVALAGEGLLVVANRGDCPLGGLQERLGDPVPLFELVLSPRAAKLAVPVLGAITGLGVALAAARRRPTPPRLAQ